MTIALLSFFLILELLHFTFVYNGVFLVSEKKKKKETSNESKLIFL